MRHKAENIQTGRFSSEGEGVISGSCNHTVCMLGCLRQRQEALPKSRRMLLGYRVIN